MMTRRYGRSNPRKSGREYDTRPIFLVTVWIGVGDNNNDVKWSYNLQFVQFAVENESIHLFIHWHSRLASWSLVDGFVLEMADWWKKFADMWSCGDWVISTGWISILVDSRHGNSWSAAGSRRLILYIRFVVVVQLCRLTGRVVNRELGPNNMQCENRYWEGRQLGSLKRSRHSLLCLWTWRMLVACVALLASKPGFYFDRRHLTVEQSTKAFQPPPQKCSRSVSPRGHLPGWWYMDILPESKPSVFQTLADKSAMCWAPLRNHRSPLLVWAEA